MNDSNGWSQFKDLGFLLLCFVLIGPLISAGFNDGPAAVFLLVFIYFAVAWVLDITIKAGKQRQKKAPPAPPAITQPRVHPSVPDITRVGDRAVQEINETKDTYLKKVETITRR